jgi:hypothetical protein
MMGAAIRLVIIAAIALGRLIVVLPGKGIMALRGPRLLVTVIDFKILDLARRHDRQVTLRVSELSTEAE